MAKIDNLILERFADAVQLLDTHKHHPLLDVPLWHWLVSDDSPMPVAWLDRSVREVLQIGLAGIALLPGIGPRKLERVMLAVDRARSAITHNDPAGPDDAGQSCGQLGNDEFPYRVACDAHFRGADQTRLEGMDERGWRCVAQLVRHHGLEGFSLGRFAQNLHELDRALWDVKISTFTQRPLSDLVLLKGCGALRLQQSICGILSLAFIL